MKVQLAADLPLTVHVGDDAYLLDLVRADHDDGCWLRARCTRDPVVFLLACFPSSGAARTALQHGVELALGGFPRRLLERAMAGDRAAQERYRDLPLREELLLAQA